MGLFSEFWVALLDTAVYSKCFSLVDTYTIYNA